jgi:GNAT superfamily N-acetyltransferase
MFHELSPAEYHRAQPLFTGLPFSLVMDAVLAGNTTARVRVNDASHPTVALLWDTRCCYYLVGDPADPSFARDARDWVAERTRSGSFYAKIHYSSAAWESVIPFIFEGVFLVRTARTTSVLTEPKVTDWAERLPTDFRIAPINERLLSASDVTGLHRVTEEITSGWSTLGEFLAHGFGCCFVGSPGPGAREEVVCWCTAECVSDERLGIGIETLPAYQGRGFATLTAAAFVEQCRETGLTPYWDAYQSNLPSLAVAQKVGFEKAADYTVFLARPQ